MGGHLQCGSQFGQSSIAVTPNRGTIHTEKIGGFPLAPIQNME
jgi:hypothetical protein